MCKEECQGSCSMEGGNLCNCSGNECGSSCGSDSGPCCQANSCSGDSGCPCGECEDCLEGKAYKYYYKAKKKLIVAKVQERLEKKYAKKLDALADAIVAYVEEQNAMDEKEDRKASALKEKFDEAFLGE